MNQQVEVILVQRCEMTEDQMWSIASKSMIKEGQTNGTKMHRGGRRNTDTHPL